MKMISRILSWGLALSVIILLGVEDYARRTWRDRATAAQMELTRAALEIYALQTDALRLRWAAEQAGEVK